MSQVFGTIYSQAYDTLYQEKDYGAECVLLEQIFKKYAAQPVHTILDLGCGTGNHTIPLASRGYNVVGVDRSEDMLDRARAKAGEQHLPVSFHRGDIQHLDLKQTFDCCIIMFAVLGYQTENAGVLGVLRTARKHLKKDGLLAADVWYGPAVLKQRPGDRIRVIPGENNSTLLRTSQGELDIRHHICKVHYHIWQINGRKLTAETEEEHLMRYFFPLELDLFLELSGFRLLKMGAFPDFDQEPDENTWNSMIVAKAV